MSDSSYQSLPSVQSVLRVSPRRAPGHCYTATSPFTNSPLRNTSSVHTFPFLPFCFPLRGAVHCYIVFRSLTTSPCRHHCTVSLSFPPAHFPFPSFPFKPTLSCPSAVNNRSKIYHSLAFYAILPPPFSLTDSQLKGAERVTCSRPSLSDFMRAGFHPTLSCSSANNSDEQSTPGSFLPPFHSLTVN